MGVREIACALVPVRAEVADQIEGACREYRVFGARQFYCGFERFGGIVDNEKLLRVVASHFRKQWSGNGAGLARFGENDGVGTGEKQAGNFVHGFIAHGTVDEEYSAVRVIFFPEFEQFARAGGIVCAVKVNVGMSTEAFETAGPFRRGDAEFDGVVVDRKAAFGEQAGGDGGRERVAQLETPWQRGSEDDFFARVREYGGRAVKAAGILYVFEARR